MPTTSYAKKIEMLNVPFQFASGVGPQKERNRKNTGIVVKDN